MNHRWKDNKCISCGIVRQKKDYNKVVRTYSKLGSDGIFYDAPIHQYGTAFYYLVNDNWIIKRPECYEGWLLKVKKEQNHYSQFKGHELNPDALRHLFIEGKTPIDALNDLSTLT